MCSYCAEVTKIKVKTNVFIPKNMKSSKTKTLQFTARGHNAIMCKQIIMRSIRVISSPISFFASINNELKTHFQ